MNYENIKNSSYRQKDRPIFISVAVFRSYLILEASKSSLIHLFLSNPDTLDEKVKRHLDLDSCGEAGMCIV